MKKAELERMLTNAEEARDYWQTRAETAESRGPNPPTRERLHAAAIEAARRGDSSVMVSTSDVLAAVGGEVTDEHSA